MSALLAAIISALLGLAVGAALQRWGDGERKLHGHKPVTAADLRGLVPNMTSGVPSEEYVRGIRNEWSGW